MRSKFWLCSLALLGLLIYGFSHLEAAENVKSVRIGMMRTIFKDTPDSLLQILMKPFSAVLESQTGLAGDLVISSDHNQLAKQLSEGKTQIGVFHGFEFAWAKLKYPDLQPLMLAVNSKAPLVSYIIVEKDSKINSVADLKGKKLALAKGNREHCRLFFEHRVMPDKTKPEIYFSKFQNSVDAEDAFDSLGDNDIDAVLADSAPWESYKNQKPGQASKLKVVVISETFIPAIIGYNPKKLDKGIMNSFKEGMLSASDNPKSKRMLEFVKITSFENIPEDFNSQLSDLVKSYPAP